MATRTSAAPTKADQTRHPELSVGQHNAIDILVLGGTDAEAATAANVTRPTVCDWRNHDAQFRAELNQARAAIWGAATDRLRGMVPVALAVLAADLAERPDARTALDVLRLAGIGEGANLGKVGIGPTTAAGIESADAEARDRVALNDLCRLDITPPRGRW